MSSLNAELQRLFLFEPVHDGLPPALVDEQGRVHAMVIELARPARWAELAQVWRGVQSELDWPAPAIAINGVDGYQLWFPLSVPLTAAQAAACLQAICSRCLPGVQHERLRLWPADVHMAAGEPPPLPPLQRPGTDVWAAFVAPDLAPVFEDTPWLDMPPSRDGQTGLLARIKTLGPTDLQHAWKSWHIGSTTAASTTASAVSSAAGAQPEPHADEAQAPASAEAAPPSPSGAPASVAGTPFTDPRHFLLSVMNDPHQPMRWRIEAAKALLPASPATT